MKKLDDRHYKDLLYREERVKHYLGLLSDLRYPLTEELVGWKHTYGDFNGPQAVDYDDSGRILARCRGLAARTSTVGSAAPW